MDRSDIKVETKSAISLRAVQKVFKGNIVLDNINLELKTGEFLSLLGSSGAGKTTLLRIIAGLEEKDGGEFELNGRDMNLVPANKRNLGMVFQQYALFPHMTVWENVAYGLKARKLDKATIKERVDKYLSLMDLSNFASRKPKELSGGQQQRVSLARALAIEPVVLLFDEPLSNLDARLKDQMLAEIHKLHRSLGFTAVYITHDQNEALYLSDKIAVLNKGKIEQFGTPEEILSTPQTAFVADFVGYTNSFDDAILVDRKAIIGNIEIPIAHNGKGSKVGDKGKVLMRTNSIKIPEFDGTILDESSSNGCVFKAYVEDSRYLGGQTELKLHLSLDPNKKFVAIVPKMIRPLPKENIEIEFLFNSDCIAFYSNNILKKYE